jgi:hypothetical protein
LIEGHKGIVAVQYYYKTTEVSVCLHLLEVNRAQHDKCGPCDTAINYIAFAIIDQEILYPPSDKPKMDMFAIRLPSQSNAPNSTESSTSSPTLAHWQKQSFGEESFAPTQKQKDCPLAESNAKVRVQSKCYVQSR